MTSFQSACRRCAEPVVQAARSVSRRFGRRVPRAVLAFAVSLWAFAPAVAAPYPERPVTIVSAFPPGGIVDIIARKLAQRFSDRFGQSFIVENRTGAAGSIGYAAAARAKADGYTLVLASGPTTMAPPGEATQGWDPLTSFSAIGMIGTIPQVIVAANAVPARNLPDFIEYAKAQRGQLNYGSAGLGTTPFFTMELFKNQQRVNLVHVPYRGQPEVIMDLIRGDLSITSVTAPLVVPHIQSGKMKALAVTSKNRLRALPDVATVHEQGMGDLGISNWFALLGPANLPPEVVATLAKALPEVLATQDMQASLEEIGLAVQPAAPAETLAFVKGDLARWIAMSKSLSAHGTQGPPAHRTDVAPAK
jgi:tripartite-type tricarboxylate transporter receptor subunit TctC